MIELRACAGPIFAWLLQTAHSADLRPRFIRKDQIRGLLRKRTGPRGVRRRANQPVVLGPGEGTHLDVFGDLITLLVSSNQTNGAFTAPGGGTPLHTHHNEDEALYVLQGEYEIQCGEQTVRAGAGAFVFAPREIPHKLTNVSSGPSKVLGIVSPAGFEGFWEEVSQLPPPPDIDQILTIAKKYRLEIHTP